jgi:cyclophilin family peptidyl-prolyl cis-trans isomerase
MKTLRLVILGCLLFVASVAMGQTITEALYAPARGETAIKLDVVGKGTIYIRLFTKEAPKTTAHIIRLVEQGFYNGKTFEAVDRVPKDYIAKVGPENSTPQANIRIPYENSGYSYDAIGMVGLSTKQKDRDSGDSQFHIMLVPAKFLDGNYTCFGRVVSGLEVLKSVKQGDKVNASIVRG